MGWNMGKVNIITWKDSCILAIGFRTKSKEKDCIFMKMEIDTMENFKITWNMGRVE